ncbi:uncharacterized mitochondrial protein AtMg00860-like [Aristolochia californica]|uniref:uncharacterized mitochondrial protein AtMg00860-like n=1 Tax=Aristolochia californica TaxID=171875 RepID=UPI0035DA911B
MNTSAFRGFLGLAEYYRKFIINYGPITAPLTNLLMKNSFIWNDQATQSFSDLKLALASAPVLQLPNFEDLFEVECDASGGGIGPFYSSTFTLLHISADSWQYDTQIAMTHDFSSTTMDL